MSNTVTNKFLSLQLFQASSLTFQCCFQVVKRWRELFLLVLIRGRSFEARSSFSWRRWPTQLTAAALYLAEESWLLCSIYQVEAAWSITLLLCVLSARTGLWMRNPVKPAGRWVHFWMGLFWVGSAPSKPGCDFGFSPPRSQNMSWFRTRMQLVSSSGAHRCAVGRRVQEAFLHGSICRRSLCLFGHVVPTGAILPQHLPAGSWWIGEESQGEAGQSLLSLQQPTQRGRAELRCLQQRSQSLAWSYWPGAASGQIPKAGSFPGKWRGRGQWAKLQLLS